jgi:hypothetical protein
MGLFQKSDFDQNQVACAGRGLRSHKSASYAGLRYHSAMKPLPAPPVPGKTEAQRFDNAVRKAFTVSKEEMQRRETEWQKTQAKDKAARGRRSDG